MKKINGFFNIVSLTIIFMYAFIILGVFLCMGTVEYFNVLPAHRSSILLCAFFVIGLPVLADVGYLTIRSSKLILQICKVIVMLFVLLCSIVYATLFLIGGGLCSYTTDLDNYQSFDERVRQDMSDNKSLLPQEVPEYAQDIKYEYLYQQTLDDEIAVTLKYRFDTLEAFEQEKATVSRNENVFLTEKTGDISTYYTAKARRVIFATFDNEEQTVIYGYFVAMSQEEIENVVSSNA